MGVNLSLLSNLKTTYTQRFLDENHITSPIGFFSARSATTASVVKNNAAADAAI